MHIWCFFRQHIPVESRQECARQILALFRAEDADDFMYQDDLLVDAGEAPPAGDA